MVSPGGVLYGPHLPLVHGFKPEKISPEKRIAEYLDMDGYVNAAYARSLAQTPRLPEDTPEEARRREISC